MTKESLRKKLEKIRTEIEGLQKEEKELTAQAQAMENAEKLKIIKKSNLSPEQLIFLNGIREEEIEMIKKKRKEAEELAEADKEKKTTDHGVIG